ncbi:L-threonine ammonia-lyase-like [Temnothorax nylanderi]|uniref:L-threonine ammonia-lyase-like n=1 Tax=Temnothorax nylanderi TaxID=102681 RepID=UPI003A8414A7
MESQFLGDKAFKIYLKEELYQFSETVKARGVVYTLLQLSNEQKRKGVITASTGSFAYSLCHFGKKFGIPVTVVMPLTTTDEEIKMCRSCADSRTSVFVYGCDMVEAHNIALRFASMKGLVYIDGNDHPNMVIGQATLGIEMMEYLLKFDAVILPTTINGCGLITGIAMAIKGLNLEIEVIEVYRSDFNSHVENIRKVTNSSDELEIPVTEYTWHEDSRGVLNCLFDRSIMVDDNLVVRAEHELKKDNIDDFNAAIGLAAFLSGELDDLREKRVLLPLFGKIDSMNELRNEQSLVTLRANLARSLE